MLLETGTMAVRAFIGNDFSFAVALPAKGGVDKLAEEATLYPPHLTGAITSGATHGLSARAGARAAAGGTELGTGDLYLFLTAQGCFFKGNGDIVTQVITAPGRLAGGGSGASEKGLEDIPEAAEIKSLESPPPEKALGTAVPEAVICRTFIGVRENLVSLIDLLELFRGAVILTAVGMILESQLPESLPDILGGGVAGNPEYFIIVTLYSHKNILSCHDFSIYVYGYSFN
jgi:hypothetical protein